MFISSFVFDFAVKCTKLFLLRFNYNALIANHKYILSNININSVA